MSDPVTPSEDGIATQVDTSAWWSISSGALMDMLYAVHEGRSPESVYVEAYNNASRQEPDSDN